MTEGRGVVQGAITQSWEEFEKEAKKKGRRRGPVDSPQVRAEGKKDASIAARNVGERPIIKKVSQEGTCWGK